MAYKILYIFPHPDDESFGPAAAIHRQIKEGNEVYLLTLTKGGATKERFKYNYSIEQMGEVRYKEMLEVKKVLHLTGLFVLDFPDSGMKEMDPRIIEKTVQEYLQKINPEIVVTYPVHGVSAFHDHLVIHPVVKRVFLQMKEDGNKFLKRLAFFTLPDNGKPLFMGDDFRVKHSEKELIDCEINLNDEDIEMLKRSLACYKTYKDKIEESGVIDKIGNKVFFEFFNENFDPPLKSLTEKII